MKRRTINLRDINRCDGGFDVNSGRFYLEFYSEKYMVRIFFKYYWVRHIALRLWEMVQRIEAIANSMRTGMEER